MQQRAQQILEGQQQAIAAIPDNNPYGEVIDTLIENIQTAGGKLVVSGIGKAGSVGQNIAAKFSSTGTPATFLHPTEAQHGDLGVLQANDVLLLLSNSGKTREIVELTYLAKQLYANIPIITITADADSELAQQSQFVLQTGNPKELGPFELTPTASTTAISAIGDVLVVLLMEKINFSRAAYALRHHSGYLGQQARKTGE